MTETKLRGRGERSFGRYVARISGVSSGWAREAVGTIVCEEWMKHLTEWKEVYSRIMYVIMNVGESKCHCGCVWSRV